MSYLTHVSMLISGATSILLFVTLLMLSVLILYFLGRRLFSGFDKDSSRSVERVEIALAGLNPNEEAHIDEMRAEFGSTMSSDIFSKLCVATALATKEPISQLSSSMLLPEYMDSLKMVEFVMLLETLYDIAIPDNEAEKLRTFREVVTCVRSKTAV